MLLSAAIDDFKRHLRDERGLSANTLLAYSRDLAGALAFLSLAREKPPSIHDVTTYHLKEYIAHLRDDEGHKPRSVARVMSTLRVFFDWLVRLDRMPSSPAVALHNPKVEKRLPVYLVGDEIDRLLRAPDRSDPVGARDHAILATFLFTGLRLSELRGLDLDSIDVTAGFVRVMGKGSKERLVPLHEALARTIVAYRENVRPGLNPACPALFLTPEGDRMTARAVGWAVQRAVARAGVNPRITPHKLRHTFATQLLHNGASLVDIKDLLGHANLATTSIYTHTTVERLERAVQRIELGDA